MKNSGLKTKRWIVKIAALLVALISLTSLSSCGDSKIDDVSNVIAEEFGSIWSLGAYDFIGVQYFPMSESNGYYITFKERDVEDAEPIEAIIVSTKGLFSEYIHSGDFERFDSNKKIYQYYLDAEKDGTLVTFSEEEIAEIQEKVESIIKEKYS